MKITNRKNNIQSGVLRRIFICIAFVLLASGCQKTQVLEVSKLTISKDTTWSGNILLAGDVYVEPGVTLTIAPGTIVKFKRIDETSDQNLFDIDSPYYPQAELIIRGKLIAKGTDKQKITFTSAEILHSQLTGGQLIFWAATAMSLNTVNSCLPTTGFMPMGHPCRSATVNLLKTVWGSALKVRRRHRGWNGLVSGPM